MTPAQKARLDASIAALVRRHDRLDERIGYLMSQRALVEERLEALYRRRESEIVVDNTGAKG